jgi:hypothetical protein
VNLNSTAPFIAVVNNDPSQSGVDWSLLCSAGNNACGSLLPLHTASGAAATYMPPPVISGNNQTFTIEAFATADHSKNLVAPITVTGFASNLKGTYVFQTRGVDANGVFQLAGVVTLDGNGNITSGEQTHSDFVLSVTDPIMGGSYSIGPDGRGSLTFNTADQNIGQLGIENLSLVFLSSAHVLIATFDNPTLQSSNETSSGTFDLQTSTAAPLHGYAFAVSGIDLATLPMSMGGVVNVDSPKTISGAGSVADQEDTLTGLFSKATVSGSVSNPDKFGAVTFNLTTSFAATPIQFTGYIVDTTHIRLIESDNKGAGSGFGVTAGQAIGQGTATGTFTTNNSLAGNYVVSILGQDFSGVPTSLASVAQFNADTSGALSGYDDEFDAAVGTEIGDSFTGTFTGDPTGIGRFDSNITFTTSGAPGPELIFYLTGNGNSPLVLDADANLFATGVGAAYPQLASSFAFNGDYGLYFTQSSFGNENDATAQITVNGSADTLSGFVDTTLFFFPQPDTQITGTFGPIPSTGLFPGTLNNTFFPSPGSSPNTVAVDFYLIDSGHGYFIETDSLTSLDLTLGYFAARTPVCATCP